MSSVDFLDRFVGRFLPRAACDNTRLSFFRVAMWCVCTLVFERRRRSFSALSLFGKKLGLDTQKSCALFFRGRTLLPLPAHPPPHDEAWRVAGSNPISVGRKFAAPEREQADAILFCSPPKTLIILFALVSKLSRPLVLPINGADYGLKRGISPTANSSAPVGPR